MDRHPVSENSKNVYIGDRGYCSYNNMAHVISKGQFFLFRTKDIHQKGLVGKFVFPKEECFDITVNVTLVRSNSSSIDCGNTYRRYIDANTSFDFLEYGSKETYPLSFRITRFELSEGTYECLVTNLPSDQFPAQRLKELYFARWGVLCERWSYTNFIIRNALNAVIPAAGSSYKTFDSIQQAKRSYYFLYVIRPQKPLIRHNICSYSLLFSSAVLQSVALFL